jgi:hypothetical protein
LHWMMNYGESVEEAKFCCVGADVRRLILSEYQMFPQISLSLVTSAPTVIWETKSPFRQNRKGL